MNDFGDVLRAATLLTGYDRPWAICGGWAIDLFLDHVTRPHKDVDFAVLRSDQLVIQEHLAAQGWALEKAVQGQLIPWQLGEWIDLPVHVIFCKNPNASPDFIELLFDEVHDGHFLYRRDPSIALPFEKVILSSSSGLPILAPEVVLLYKSARPEEPAAAADFKNAVPKLSRWACEWLAAALKQSNPDHIWLNNLL